MAVRNRSIRRSRTTTSQLSQDHHYSLGKVLMLNANYEPLSICSVEKAIILLCCEKVELVHEWETKKLRSPSTTFPYPTVVKLSTFKRVPYKKLIASRKNILRRDGHRCQYCGNIDDILTVDHVMPKSRGGQDTWENLITACLRCNNRKGNQTPEEAGMPLRSRPVRPNHVTFMRQFVGSIHNDWKPYLFM